MPNNSGMTVHAGRAILEESNNFTNEGKAVGEYVKNSWQYTDGPTTVSILVDQKNKSIQIKDTSRGMDRHTLDNNFFVLNQQNKDRREGIIGRGEYGTGKIAALGIGETLRVKTVRNKILHIFELRRKDCDADISQNAAKIRWIKEGENIDEENGTTIEILNFRQDRNISVKNIKRFLRLKTLVENKAYKHPIELYVEHEKIEKIEIDYIDLIIKKPTEEEKKIFGDCELTIKVATRNLNEDEKGISVFAKGIYKAKINNPHGEKSEFIFGECTCDKLTDEVNPPIFDSSRREELNTDNDVAKSFLAFVNYHVDSVRKELIKKDSDRKKKERNEALQKEADKMKEFFNSDYKELELNYQKKIAKAKGNIDEKQDFKFQLGETKIVTGDDFSVKIIDGDDGAFTTHGGGGGGEGGGGGGKKPEVGKIEKTDEETNNKGKEKSVSKKRSGGGFNFEYDKLGIDGKRAIYVDESRLIKINLDHPLISKTLETTNNDQESPIFKRASYEAAIFEYAVAVTQQKSSSNLMEDSVSDAVFEIQDCVDRMLKKMAKLNLFNE